MDYYYVNKNTQSNGDNEVHKEGCSWMPETNNREYLGYYSSCQEAVGEARRRGYKANGCYFCSYNCHTS